MRKFVLAASALAATLVAAAPATAQSYDRYRDWRQEQRIRDGWRDGQESPWEYRQLQRQQYEIDRFRRIALRDGYLSPSERRHLQYLRDRASRNIYRQRHDRDDYGDRYYDNGGWRR